MRILKYYLLITTHQDIVMNLIENLNTNSLQNKPIGLMELISVYI